jgi:hypothetical protein
MTERDTAASFLGQLRVIVVAGIAAGVVLVGAGSRLAMLLLRLTSPDEVRGVTSDDGFTIGEVTLFGTYNLLNLGAAVGLIGAFAYWLVAPWLIGPRWFRRFTTGLAAGAIAGSMLIHADGVDFTALQPTWLAIGVFVALPAMFGYMIGVAVDAVEDEESWINRGRRRSILPFVLPVLFPVSIFVLLVVTLALLVCWRLRALPIVQRISVAKPYGFAVRSTFLLIAALGFWALVGDIQALA